ncbi:hypothetical protein [Rhizobium sp. BK602]|uniref:hypothetical protein n=1 Tax=Rhizobium sp. BK602 TaxID=2586986 RepID=UPI001608DBA6|nr:hypothetical protein [Rhizobium sp. BK602]MBB3610978.1 hypothetical protein [Rhizobium sp. BK602]
MSVELIARKPPIVASSTDESRLAAIGWAMTHKPTQDAYRRSTGDDVGPALDRYQVWLAENIIGEGEATDC